MTNLQDKLHERVFVPTSVEKELPTENGEYLSCLDIKFSDDSFMLHPFAEGKFWKQYDVENESGVPFNVFNITHWLKESEPSYLLTPLELLELKKKWASEVFDASRDAEAESWSGIDFKYPDKETYINSLTL